MDFVNVTSGQDKCPCQYFLIVSAKTYCIELNIILKDAELNSVQKWHLFIYLDDLPRSVKCVTNVQSKSCNFQKKLLDEILL